MQKKKKKKKKQNGRSPLSMMRFEINPVKLFISPKSMDYIPKTQPI